MFERFTDRARRVVVLAQEEARRLDHGHIGTEHLLLGLISEGQGLAAKALDALGVVLEPARQEVARMFGASAGAQRGGHIPFTPRAKNALELSLREALQLGHNYIGTEHILLGLIREGKGGAVEVLVALGADPAAVRRQVISQIHGARGDPGAEVPGVPAAERTVLARAAANLGSRGGGQFVPAAWLRSRLSAIESRLTALEQRIGTGQGSTDRTDPDPGPTGTGPTGTGPEPGADVG